MAREYLDYKEELLCQNSRFQVDKTLIFDIEWSDSSNTFIGKGHCVLVRLWIQRLPVCMDLKRITVLSKSNKYFFDKSIDFCGGRK